VANLALRDASPQRVLGYLAAGSDSKAILREFPDLTQENVAACLDYARDLAEFNAVAA
jgi:uncharacterized protein (DUF433 family)